jgi:hypothetical protein
MLIVVVLEENKWLIVLGISAALFLSTIIAIQQEPRQQFAFGQPQLAEPSVVNETNLDQYLIRLFLPSQRAMESTQKDLRMCLS